MLEQITWMDFHCIQHPGKLKADFMGSVANWRAPLHYQILALYRRASAFIGGKCWHCTSR
jgi:hypothetical protein